MTHIRGKCSYQLRVMFSVDTTSAYLLGVNSSICLARSTEMMPAEQPMPVQSLLFETFYLH